MNMDIQQSKNLNKTKTISLSISNFGSKSVLLLLICMQSIYAINLRKLEHLEIAKAHQQLDILYFKNNNKFVYQVKSNTFFLYSRMLKNVLNSRYLFVLSDTRYLPTFSCFQP
jgi:hypothetical protein